MTVTLPPQTTDLSARFPGVVTAETRPGYAGFIVEKDSLVEVATAIRDELGFDLLDPFILYCRDLPMEGGDNVTRGSRWSDGDLLTTRYVHIMTPNAPSCMNRVTWDSAYTAASMHPGGVQVLFGDNHLQFVNELIDAVAWREMGSRTSSPVVP